MKKMIMMTEEEFAERIFEAQNRAYEEGKRDGFESAKDEFYVKGYEDSLNNFEEFEQNIGRVLRKKNNFNLNNFINKNHKDITMRDIINLRDFFGK